METLLAACAFPRIDFLKLDVEGAEHEVLAGNPAWLTRVKVPCSASTLESYSTPLSGRGPSSSLQWVSAS